MPVKEQEVEEEAGLRSQMWKHEAMVPWLNEQYGVDLEQMSAAEVIAYAFAGRVDWRKSDEYVELVEAYRAEAAERAAEAKAAREAAAAEKAAAEEEEAPTKAAAKKTSTKKAAAAAAPTKATRKRAAAGSEESPFA